MEYEKEQWVDALQQYLNSGKGDFDTIISKVFSLDAQLAVTSVPCRKCSLHRFYYPNKSDKLECKTVLIKIPCSLYHEFCRECGYKYFKEHFSNYGFTMQYCCPACLAQNVIYNIEGEVVTEILGQGFIQRYDNSLSLRTSAKSLAETLQSCQVESASCRKGKSIFRVGLCRHVACNNCIRTATEQNLKSLDIRCPLSCCDRPIFHQILRAALEKTELLKSLWGKLELDGIKQMFCRSCKDICEVDPTQDIFTCSCSNQMCARCGMNPHVNQSCSDYYVRSLEFEIREITEEDEKFSNDYARARTAFSQTVNSGDYKVSKIEKVINRDLLEKYEMKKREFTEQNIDPCEQIVWHSSSDAAFSAIAKTGFLIGGTEGHKVRVGKLFGYGIYTATEPSFTFRYTVDGLMKVMCCRAMRGMTGPEAKSSEDLHRLGTHSHIPAANQSIFIYFTTEQVLPEFIISYRKRN